MRFCVPAFSKNQQNREKLWAIALYTQYLCEIVEKDLLLVHKDKNLNHWDYMIRGPRRYNGHGHLTEWYNVKVKGK